MDGMGIISLKTDSKLPTSAKREFAAASDLKVYDGLSVLPFNDVSNDP